MNEKVKSYLEKAKELLGKVSKRIWILLAALLVVVAVAIGVLVSTHETTYSVLFTDLSTGDMSAILTYLDEAGASDYQIQDGDTILVPANQETVLKAKVLQQGYPTSGFAYSTYFDNVSALSTEAERNTAYLMALEERMSAVVECFDGVKDAAVTINQGEDRSYVLDSGNIVEASAGVFVTMKDGKTLTKDQAAAIRNLVARSVKGLEMDSITISDAYGNQYIDTNSASDADASALKLQLEQENNNKIRASVMQVLEPIFGEGNVSVGVNCTVEVNHTVQNSTDVKLPEGSADGKGIIGSMIYENFISRDDEEGTAGGVVGTEQNSDISSYVDRELGNVGNSTISASSSGQIDYNNSQTETYVERTAGYISDCTVSVSINTKKVTGELDLDAIRAHVARAAGISSGTGSAEVENTYLASKISVLAMPFYEEPAITPIIVDENIPEWVLYAAASALLLIVILIVVVILLIRSNRKKKKAAVAAQLAMEQSSLNEALAQMMREREEVEQAGADVMAIHSERSMELRRDIREFADTNPEIAAQMVRIWLRGGEDDD